MTGAKISPQDGPADSDAAVLVAEDALQSADPQMGTQSVLLSALLTVLLALPTIVYIYAFSALGSGPATFRWAQNNDGWETPVSFWPLTVVYVTLLSMLYLCDGFLYWVTPGMLMLRNLMLGISAICFVMSTIATCEHYAYAPTSLFLVGLPVYLVAVFKVGFHNRVSFRRFVGLLNFPLLLVGLGAVLWWVVWIASEGASWSNKEFQIELAQKARCVPDKKGTRRLEALNVTSSSAPSATPIVVSDCDSGDDSEGITYDECLQPFVMWATPMVVGFACLCAAFITTLFVPQYHKDHKHVSPKTLASVLAIVLVGMWCTASLSCAAPQVSEAFFMLLMSALIAVCVMVMASYGTAQVLYESENNAFVKETVAKFSAYGDVFRALFVWTSMPIAAGLLAISALNQAIRCARWFPYTKLVTDDDERSKRFTKVVQNMLDGMRDWRWTKVLKFSIYWGIAYVSVQVLVSKVVYLLLSWLIEQCSNMSIGAVTLVIVAIGLFLFLLPPVPGVPIYLFAGILLFAVGKRPTTDGGLGSGVLAVIYACCVSIVIKLFACTIQQKGFGEQLGKNVNVRQMVGVNSDMIRTMKIVLGERGLTKAKVAILVGGPDWPTSVLCGIMGLPLLPVLLGTLPVWLLIIPTVLTGTFTYAENTTLSAMFFLGAFSVQSGSGVVAMFYLDKAMEENRAILSDKSDLDVAVRKLDEDAQKKAELYDQLTEWSVLPKEAKCTLQIATVLMILSFYMLFGLTCFEPFVLNKTITCQLDGNAFNLVNRNGKVALVLCGASCLLLVCFQKWAGAKVAKAVAAGASATAFSPTASSPTMACVVEAGSGGSSSDSGDAGSTASV